MATVGEVAWSFFDLMSQGRIEDAVAVLDDEGTFWEVMTRDTVRMPDHKVALAGSLKIVPMTFTQHSLLELGEQVVIEVESSADLEDGSIYNNLYCFILTIRGDKILHVREYMDTAHVLNLPKAMRRLLAGRPAREG